MSEKNYSQFINSLQQEGANKKEVNTTKLYIFWSLFVLLFSLLALTVVGVRSDFPAIFYSKQFILESLTLLWLLFITSVWAIRLSIPGRESHFSLWSSFVPFLLWNFLLSLSYIYEYSTSSFVHHLHSSFGAICFSTLFLIGVPPSLALLFLVRKNRPVLLKRTGLMIFFSGMSLAGLLMQLHCGDSDPLHIFTSHLLPVVIVGILGFAGGGKLLRW